MCGIIARIGQRKQSREIVSKLKALEYRGYDSFGVASACDETYTTQVIKKVGVIQFEDISNKHESVLQIAHTRWATNGEVSQENAHPHSSSNNLFHVVMNGIIENVSEIIQEELLEYSFTSQTDTELIVALAQKFKDRDKSLSLVELSKKINSKLKGEFSYVLMNNLELVVYKNSNPIIIGRSKDNDIEEYYICSDMRIIEKSCSLFYVLEDEEICNLKYIDNYKNQIKSSKENLKEYTVKITIEKEGNTSLKNGLAWKNTLESDLRGNETSKCNLTDELREYCSTLDISSTPFEFNMHKEIYEQTNLVNIGTKYNVEKFKEIAHNLFNSKKQIFLLAAGTSYHAALSMHYILLKYNINSTPIVASESESYENVMKDGIVLVFSQSGETADCLYSLKKLKKYNSNIEIYSIINTQHSTLDRMANYSLYLHCGEEKSVASTKAFMHQYVIVLCIEMYLKYETIIFKDKEKSQESILKDDPLTYIRTKIANLLVDFSQHIFNYIEHNSILIKDQAEEIKDYEHIFYIGKELFYPLALEGALKLKEITYSNVSGFAAGELKHGSLALISSSTPVIILGENALTSACECQSRGAILYMSPTISNTNHTNETFKSQLENIKKSSSKLEEESEEFEEYKRYKKHIESILYIQLLAYFTALKKGKNPDRPRNLAKSVTVR